MRSNQRTQLWLLLPLVILLLVASCAGEATGEATPIGSSADGAAESDSTAEAGERREEVDASSDSSQSGNDSASGDDSAFVGSFQVNGVAYEFGWSSCLVEEIPGSSFPTKIINATGTQDFPTMSLSITSAPSAIGGTQGVRITLPDGTYLLSQSLSESGEVVDDLVTPGTTLPLFSPTGPFERILIDRDWQTLDGADAVQIPARLELTCLESA